MYFSFMHSISIVVNYRKKERRRMEEEKTNKSKI